MLIPALPITMNILMNPVYSIASIIEIHIGPGDLEMNGLVDTDHYSNHYIKTQWGLLIVTKACIVQI